MSSTNLAKHFIIVLFCLFILFTSGCDNPIVPPPVNDDNTYTLTIISQSDTVFGTVYVDGTSTGKTLDANDSVQIAGIESGSVITIKDNFGFESHSELFTAPNTSIVFTHF